MRCPKCEGLLVDAGNNAVVCFAHEHKFKLLTEEHQEEMRIRTTRMLENQKAIRLLRAALQARPYVMP